MICLSEDTRTAAQQVGDNWNEKEDTSSEFLVDTITSLFCHSLPISKIL